ncbi:hypothetical protein RRG08_029679 [Elysia crispata]|uniref:Uncharacterized protein n=1 Tax=Elysia crispata TaxID=231223 RepID=A0AAE1BEG2_9GAST|nr:hypothetical protein RRG08_029679 [Elysia crispata]
MKTVLYCKRLGVDLAYTNDSFAVHSVEGLGDLPVPPVLDLAMPQFKAAVNVLLAGLTKFVTSALVMFDIAFNKKLASNGYRSLQTDPKPTSYSVPLRIFRSD